MQALRVVVVLSFLGAVAAFGAAGWLWLTRPDAPPPPARGADAVPGPPLEIVGFLDDPMVAGVRAAIGQAARPPAQVFIRSGGGTEANARQLADMINGLGAELVVADHALCASGCVILLVDVPRRRISPTAWLRVQGFADTMDAPAAASMAPWVGRLSARWLAFLQGCRGQPLQWRAGLTMQWQEIQRLEADPRAIDCNAIAYRTADWTSAHLTRNLLLDQ